MAVLLASCHDYDNGLSDQEIHYTGEFHKAFGEIDSEQDFNLAERAYVFVTPGSSKHIRVYSRKGDKTWSIVADYGNVDYPREIGFDVVEGTENVIVTDGITAETVNVGGSVSFVGGATRAGTWDYADDFCDIHLNEGLEYSYYYYDLSVKDEIAEKLPEGKRNRDMTIQNFQMVSNGPFVVYPLYWYCGYLDYIGLYYINSENEIVEHNLFGNHIFNESVQMLDSTGHWNSSLRYNDWAFSGKSSDYTDGYPRALSQALVGFADPSATQFRSKGYVVDLPAGTVFGFYVNPRYYSRYVPYNASYINRNFPELMPDCYGQFRNYYSDASLNPLDCIGTPDGRYADTIMYCFATYFDSRGDLVLCADDAIGGEKYGNGYVGAIDNRLRIFDYNDIAMKIYGAIPEVISNTSSEWLLPFEDLGSSFDLDFNDIILKLNYVSGSDKAYITPMAAGGTLHSEVYFNDTGDDQNEQDLGEIHVLLGATPIDDKEMLYDPINADTRGTPGSMKIVTVHDPENYSVANAMNESTATTSEKETQGVVGIYIETHSTEGTSIVAYSGMGKVPAMLVLPQVYQLDNRFYEWAWPTELTDIRTSYGVQGHSFAEWIADHTKAADWYMYPNGVTVGEKSSEHFVNILITDPEYDLSDFGTIVPLPSRDADGHYSFDSNILDGRTSVTLTLVMKGVSGNSLYVYDGGTLGTEKGTWVHVGYGGIISILGNNSCGEGSGSTSYEGIYQIYLTSEEVDAIRQAGHFAITADDGSSPMAVVLGDWDEQNDLLITDEDADENEPALARRR